MKTIIIFTTHHGTTEKVAHLISSEMQAFGESAIEIVPLKQIHRINLNNYDQIVLGTSVHTGNPSAEMIDFINDNRELLLSKRCALYLIGMNEKETGQGIEKAFPEELREHAIQTKYLGGEFIFERMNIIEKAMIKKIAGINESISKLKTEEIKTFARNLVP